jgi:hypothetical protein
MNRICGSAIVGLIISIGCGGPAHNEQSAREGSASASSSHLRTTDSSKPANLCPRTGLWAQCSVEKRLSQSGFVVRQLPDSAKRRSGFSVMPISYVLGRSRLDVFIYPNADAVAREVESLDTTIAGPRGARNQWGVGVQPTFVRSANLIAVFLTDNPTQSERLMLALTAGAPQP